MKQNWPGVVVGSLLVLLTAAPTAAHADDPPRVGLVLSGGAALGSAHVGVLKVLEELRIPVAFVAGTSMGAIVGGLYAAGLSPAEMEQILAETDWRDLLDDRPPRQHLPYRQKVDDQTYLAAFEAGFNRGAFQIPPGLISGQKLGFALQQMALRTAGIDDFDRLPIPFRAIATDLENGDMVVLGRGDLGQAMRASMSLPGIFSPIEHDGRLLVDGGLVRNLPVDVARNMGAEIIIAVDVGQPLSGKEQLASMAKVTGQMIGLQIRRNVAEQAAAADVLIRPKLEGFNATQFERGLEMLPFGEEAARRETAALARYSVSEEAYRAYLDRIRQPSTVSRSKVSFVQLTRSSTADAKFVLGRVRTRPGDPLDLEMIRQDLERLYETGDYERVDFNLTQVGGDYGLYIEAIEKSWGPNYLRFGLNLFADFEGESSFDVLASYTMTKLNRQRGELKVQAQLGENPAFAGELFQPLSLDQTWFAAVRLNQATTTEFLPLADGGAVAVRADLLNVNVDFGLQLGRFGEIRLGLNRGRVDTRLRDGASSAPAGTAFGTETDLGGLRLSAVIDQFDNMNFPRHGYLVVVDYLESKEDLGATSDYRHLVGFLGGAVTRGRHTLLGLFNLYSALGTDSPEVYDLGGLFELSGTPADSVTGQYGGNLSLLYLHRLFDLPNGIGKGLYIGASIEGGNLWDEREQVSLGDLRYAGSLFIGVDTVFGPLYLAQGFSEAGDDSLYFFVGRSF